MYKIDVVVMFRVRFDSEPEDTKEEWKRQLFQIKLDVYAQKVRLWLGKQLSKMGTDGRIGLNLNEIEVN